MNINWKGNLCLLCLKEKELSCEHLIPSSIGGILTSSFICKECNSLLGSDVEAWIRSDPTIRLASDNLRDVIPSLSAKLEMNQPFIIYSENGKESAYAKNGEIHVHSRKLEDGSLMQSTKNTRSTISNILKKEGVPPHEIKSALDQFENLEPNTKTEIHPKLDVITWAGEKVELDLSKSKLLTPLVPLKIAFEFLALHLGVAIYDKAPQFQELRAAILDRNVNASCFKVERLTSGSFRTFHGICHEGNAPYTTVQVRLFGSLAFRVHFLKIAVNDSRFSYTHELNTGKEYISEINKNAT